jgi:uncharacterized protein
VGRPGREAPGPGRRGAALVIAACALLTAGLGHAQTCGDADGDGTVTGDDGRRILQAAAALAVDCPVDACDVDGDGAITDRDGVRVLRLAAGQEAALSCPLPGARRTMLQGLTTVVIVPGYRALDAAAGRLRAAVDALQAGPTSATLAGAQEAWRRLRRAWKQTEAFRLGPSEELRTAARIDWSPVRPDRIEEEIAGAASFTDDYIDALGAPKVGALAIEYLLFDPVGGNAAVLGTLAAPESARRREYLVALARNVAIRTAELRAAWEPAEGRFGDDLVRSGIDGRAFATLKAAVDELVNRMIFTAETVEETRIGDALGVARAGGPDPTRLESPRSGNSRDDALDDLRGIRAVYLGVYRGFPGAGVSGVTAALSPEVDAEIRTRLDAAIATLSAVPPPLATALLESPAAVDDAYHAVQDLRRALVVDLASVLGTTLTFGGTDGD